jgi:hypothetical protein
MSYVLKWHVPVDDHWHPIGPGPVVLTEMLQSDNHVVCVWTVEENADLNSMQARPAKVYGTGQEVPADCAHLGTCRDGRFVWHVFGATQRTVNL